MKIYDFICTSKPKQVQALKRNGVYLANRVEEGKEVKLFALGEFYVETTSTSSGGVAIFRTFKTCSRLAPYLDDIDLSTFLT